MQKVVKTRRSKMFCGVVWMFQPILSNVASRYPSSYHDRCSYQVHFLLDTHICMSIRFLLMGNVDKDHADIQCLQNSESRLYPETSQHQENALRVHTLLQYPIFLTFFHPKHRACIVCFNSYQVHPPNAHKRICLSDPDSQRSLGSWDFSKDQVMQSRN